MDVEINSSGEDKFFHDDRKFRPASLASKSYPDLGPYQNREVVSALRKEIKLGRLEQALYWLTVMLDLGDGSASHRSYIARQLWIVAGEDIYDQNIVLQAYAVFQMTNVCYETDHLYNLVSHMVKAPKIHNTEDGIAMDTLWGKAQGQIRRGEFREMPSYAVDRHTYRGKSMRNKTDERFSGTTYGRIATRYLYARDGENFGPQSQLDDDFHKKWAEIQELYGENLPSKTMSYTQDSML